VLVNISSNLGN